MATATASTGWCIIPSSWSLTPPATYRTDVVQQRGQAEEVNRQIWLTRDKRVLGHASVRTTQIYAHVTKQEARRLYLANHPMAKRSAGGD